jgi:HAE1 family hydrophobic/amphiphilic exporter-1
VGAATSPRCRCSTACARAAAWRRPAPICASRLDELKARDGVALDVRIAVNAVQEAVEIVTALSGTVEQAERAAVPGGKGYELGVKRHLEVQDAQLNLQLAKSSLVRARRDYHVARVNLAWAAGTLESGAPTPIP